MTRVRQGVVEISKSPRGAPHHVDQGARPPGDAGKPLGRVAIDLQKVDRQQSSEARGIDSWSRDEVEKLLDVARMEEPGFYPLLTFLLSTGYRRREALGLRWEDLDFAGNRILIRRALVRGRLGTPKSGTGRTVVLSPSLGAILRVVSTFV